MMKYLKEAAKFQPEQQGEDEDVGTGILGIPSDPFIWTYSLLSRTG